MINLPDYNQVGFGLLMACPTVDSRKENGSRSRSDRMFSRKPKPTTIPFVIIVESRSTHG